MITKQLCADEYTIIITWKRIIYEMTKIEYQSSDKLTAMSLQINTIMNQVADNGL